MKFGLFFQMQLPKPLDNNDWYPGQDAVLLHNVLDQIELADHLSFDYVWLSEHHCAGACNHLSATDVVPPVIAMRTKQIRIGTAITQMIPQNNHSIKIDGHMATRAVSMAHKQVHIHREFAENRVKFDTHD